MRLSRKRKTNLNMEFTDSRFTHHSRRCRRRVLWAFVAAKKYLQFTGAHAPESDSVLGVDGGPDANSVLVIEPRSDIGRTWARDRLYPNLLSQNSYGQYEFSDLPRSAAVHSPNDDEDHTFIPGWRINRYLYLAVTSGI